MRIRTLCVLLLALAVTVASQERTDEDGGVLSRVTSFLPFRLPTLNPFSTRPAARPTAPMDDHPHAAHSTRSTPQGQQEERNDWPELVGWKKEDAKAWLERKTGKQVFLISEMRGVTMDYIPERIRVFFDADNLVSQIPRVG